MANLQNGVNEIISGVETKRHCRQLGFRRVFQLNVEAEPFGSVLESLSQCGNPALVILHEDSFSNATPQAIRLKKSTYVSMPSKHLALPLKSDAGQKLDFSRSAAYSGLNEAGFCLEGVDSEGYQGRS